MKGLKHNQLVLYPFGGQVKDDIQKVVYKYGWIFVSNIVQRASKGIYRALVRVDAICSAALTDFESDNFYTNTFL